MQKQELVHLHALCARLREYVAERQEGPPDAFATDEALDVNPTQIHRQKADHHAAVLTLVAGIAMTVSDDAESPVRKPVDHRPPSR
jgi:hypothetical protein